MTTEQQLADLLQTISDSIEAITGKRCRFELSINDVPDSLIDPTGEVEGVERIITKGNNQLIMYSESHTPFEIKPKTKSELLYEEAAQEDNDLAYLDKHQKAVRQERFESFEKDINILTDNNCLITLVDGAKYTINTQTDKYGIVDFYPKANKVLVRKHNKWHNHGIKWINDNLIK